MDVYRRLWRVWRPRRRLFWFLLAMAAIVALAPVVRHAKRRGRTVANVPPPEPLVVPASGKCLALLQPMGPVPCPYGPAAGAIDGIDWAKPFERAHGRCVAVGQLAVTSGRVVATDPLVYPDHAALAPALPIGPAPVVLALSDDPYTRDRNAFALLQLRPERPVRWDTVADEYAVDAGTGAFADLATMRLFSAREERESDRVTSFASAQVDPGDQDAWWRAVDKAGEGVPSPLDVMRSEGYAEHDYVNQCVDPATGANMVVFEAGWGDGVYQSHIGRDAAGAVVAIVTDFGLIDMGAGRHPLLEHLDP